MTGVCERSNEPSGNINGEELLDHEPDRFRLVSRLRMRGSIPPLSSIS
jgi:hypothetical protein